MAVFGCLLATGHALAANPTTLTVGGTDVLNGGYWTINADGTLTEASADNYNVYYDGSGTLTLKDATINGTSSSTVGAVVGGTAANIGGGQADNLYFGTYQQSSGGNGGYNIDPIKWRVLENAGGQLFLLSDQNLDVFQYHTDWEEITWERSTMRSWLNGYGASENAGGDSGTDYTSDNFIGTAFSEKEQKAIAETTVVNDDNPNHNTDGGNNTTDKIFLLSIAEASNSSYFADDASRISTNTAYVVDGGKIGGDMYSAGKGDWWWLRSPGGDDHSAAGVAGNGDVDNAGVTGDDKDRAVRPAFHLDLNSVLFTSAAAGGKSASGMDSGLTAVGDYDGNEWKLTLLDDSRSFSVTETTVSGDRGTTVTLHYSGATTGINEYISVLLTDEQGNALYYGRVAEPNSAEGEVSLTIPDALAAGTYTLNVFSEQYNGDYQTDYASAFEAVTLTVSATPEQINGVYQIKTANNLFWFAALVNGTLTDGTAQNAAACAVLTTNIDLTGEAWTPIGSESNPYTGTFDGQNHTISGMTIENAESYSGLFGNVTGTVRDFTVTGSITITGDETVSRVGGAVGSLGTASVGGTVSGVTSGVNITVSAGNDHIGGVVGSMPENSSPTVENCVYTGNITVTVEAGSVAGVVGYIRTGTIQNCANQGGISVSGSGNGSVGGILGYCNNESIKITACYNTGIISASGTANVGAIVGNNRDDNNHVGQATVSNCYYLTGSADKGQGQLDTDAVGTVVKDDNAFTSGEVACLLQGDQTVQVWGQTLGTDNYPVLTTDEAMRVYAAKLYKGSADDATDIYANASGISSPEGNALLVIEDAVSATTGTNIVVKSGEAYTCANLVLTDGADFYTPVAFTAAQATYSRQPQVYADGSQGWETLCLPFGGQLQVDDTPLTPVTTGAEGGYWLRRLTGVSGTTLLFSSYETGADASIEAGVPYIIALPGSEFEGESLEGKAFSVVGTDVTVSMTTNRATADTYTFGGAYATTPVATGSSYLLNADGSLFELQAADATSAPFRAYITADTQASTRGTGSLPPCLSIGNGDGTLTGIESAPATDADELRVYGAAGRLVIRTSRPLGVTVCNMQGQLLWHGTVDGERTLELESGVYVVNGKKGMVR